MACSTIGEKVGCPRTNIRSDNAPLSPQMEVASSDFLFPVGDCRASAAPRKPFVMKLLRCVIVARIIAVQQRIVDGGVAAGMEEGTERLSQYRFQGRIPGSPSCPGVVTPASASRAASRATIPNRCLRSAPVARRGLPASRERSAPSPATVRAALRGWRRWYRVLPEVWQAPNFHDLA